MPTLLLVSCHSSHSQPTQRLAGRSRYATWKGCFKVEQLDRRVDLLVVPYARIAPALIYFTGSGLLCRQMRGQAMKMGMRLNEKMLMDVRTGDEIRVETERDVFSRLGMQYIEPGERENVGIGFHFTKADRAKQLAAASQQRSVGNNQSKISAANNPVLAAHTAQADQSCASTLQMQSKRPPPTIAAPAPGTKHTGGTARRRRIFLVGDQNLMAPENCDDRAAHCRLHAKRCVGMLLQQEASKKRELIGEIEVRVLGCQRPARL